MLLKNVLVMNLDGVPDDSGEIFPESCISLLGDQRDGIVYVTDFHIKQLILGMAKLRREPSAIYADITLGKEGAEQCRRIAKSGGKIWPAIGGMVINADQWQRDKEGRQIRIISYIGINEIALNTTMNCDKRIPPLKIEG